jgi:pyruvate/2-oxoglutarate dehydrogenase complex dihydrolipoamide dehydrogenase (E3) component
LTNANFFNLTELPGRMLVVGCGPIGLELSQSMTAFGCKVTGIEYFSQILTKEDPEAAAILTAQLEKDGIVNA